LLNLLVGRNRHCRRNCRKTDRVSVVQQVDRRQVRVSPRHPRVLPTAERLEHDGRGSGLSVPRRPGVAEVVTCLDQGRYTGSGAT